MTPAPHDSRPTHAAYRAARIARWEGFSGPTPNRAQERERIAAHRASLRRSSATSIRRRMALHAHLNGAASPRPTNAAALATTTAADRVRAFARRLGRKGA